MERGRNLLKPSREDFSQMGKLHCNAEQYCALQNCCCLFIVNQIRKTKKKLKIFYLICKKLIIYDDIIKKKELKLCYII